MRATAVVASILIGVSVAALIAYFILERMKNKTIFNPRSKVVWVPAQNTYSNLYFTSSSGNRLNGWLFNTYPDRPVILYCHGNFGNMSYRKIFVEIADILHCNIFMFDYSGYGNSSGSPSLINLREDSLSAFEYLRRYYKDEDIIVWGKSLGGYAALTIAAEYPTVKGVLICSTFSTFDMIISEQGIKAAVMRFLIRKFTDCVPTNQELIQRISSKNSNGTDHNAVPITIMHSTDDDFIPYSNGLDLNDNCTVKCSFVPIKGGHASPYITLESFVSSLLHIGTPLPVTDEQSAAELLDNLQVQLSKLPMIKSMLDL